MTFLRREQWTINAEVLKFWEDQGKVVGCTIETEYLDAPANERGSRFRIIRDAHYFFIEGDSKRRMTDKVTIATAQYEYIGSGYRVTMHYFLKDERYDETKMVRMVRLKAFL